MEDLPRKRIGADQHLLPRTDLGDVLLVDLGRDAQRGAARHPEKRLVGADHLADLAVAADDRAGGRRDEIEVMCLRLGALAQRLGLLPIGPGPVIGAARRDPALDKLRLAVELRLGIALLGRGGIDRAAQIVVFEPREQLSLFDDAALVDLQLDEPCRAARRDRHHDARLDGPGRVDRLNGRAAMRLDDGDCGREQVSK